MIELLLRYRYVAILEAGIIARADLNTKWSVAWKDKQGSALLGLAG